MRRISISVISTGFAFLALGICAYSLFYSFEIVIKTQAIYWFCIALVAAVVPYLKDLTPYIRRVKVGEVEVELNELRKEVQAVRNELDDVMARLGKVSQKEASLTKEEREFRQKIFSNFAEILAKNTPEGKLLKQEHYTQVHLRGASMKVSELKETLKKLDYYHGPIDESFSLELAQAVEKFQADNGEIADGIAGTITLSKIRELLPSQRGN
jgi:murein L,D-transpeptidase YcbB/YkuD